MILYPFAMQPRSHLPSHGRTAARSSTRRSKVWAIRPPGSRTTHHTPVATGHPYHLPSHAEIHDVPDPSLITSTNPIAALQPPSNMEAVIDQHIGQSSDGDLWSCTHCNKKSGKRRNRIWDHVAACLGYEIYRCTGGCGNDTWCVPSPLNEQGENWMPMSMLQPGHMQNPSESSRTSKPSVSTMPRMVRLLSLEAVSIPNLNFVVARQCFVRIFPAT
jgi:hypothetical protein